MQIVHGLLFLSILIGFNSLSQEEPSQTPENAGHFVLRTFDSANPAPMRLAPVTNLEPILMLPTDIQPSRGEVLPDRDKDGNPFPELSLKEALNHCIHYSALSPYRSEKKWSEPSKSGMQELDAIFPAYPQETGKPREVGVAITESGVEQAGEWIRFSAVWHHVCTGDEAIVLQRALIKNRIVNTEHGNFLRARVFGVGDSTGVFPELLDTTHCYSPEGGVSFMGSALGGLFGPTTTPLLDGKVRYCAVGMQATLLPVFQAKGDPTMPVMDWYLKKVRGFLNGEIGNDLGSKLSKCIETGRNQSQSAQEGYLKEESHLIRFNNGSLAEQKSVAAVFECQGTVARDLYEFLDPNGPSQSKVLNQRRGSALASVQLHNAGSWASQDILDRVTDFPTYVVSTPGRVPQSNEASGVGSINQARVSSYPRSSLQCFRQLDHDGTEKPWAFTNLFSCVIRADVNLNLEALQALN